MELPAWHAVAAPPLPTFIRRPGGDTQIKVALRGAPSPHPLYVEL